MPQKSKAIAADVPDDQLVQLVEAYQHRVFSLEAELHEFARGGALSEGDYRRRLKAVHDLHADLRELVSWARSAIETDVTHRDIGLPIIGSCTPAEARVCAIYLKEKGTQIKALRVKVERVYKWLEDALRGNVGPVRQTLRLSKLRQLTLIIEQSTGNLRERSTVLARHVSELVNQTPKGREHGLTTLKALQSLFARIDTSTQRVAKLTASIKREELKTQEMCAWLDKERAERAERWPAMEPPTPLTMSRAITSYGIDPASWRVAGRKHLAIAEQFHETESTPVYGGADTDTAAAAAQLLAEVRQ
ncbi:MAG: hypothetical protein RL011_2448 [Pseudomonadota bacterium]